MDCQKYIKIEWKWNAVANASTAIIIMENIICKHNYFFSSVEIFWKKQNKKKTHTIIFVPLSHKKRWKWCLPMRVQFNAEQNKNIHTHIYRYTRIHWKDLLIHSHDYSIRIQTIDDLFVWVCVCICIDTHQTKFPLFSTTHKQLAAIGTYTHTHAHMHSLHIPFLSLLFCVIRLNMRFTKWPPYALILFSTGLVTFYGIHVSKWDSCMWLVFTDFSIFSLVWMCVCLCMCTMFVMHRIHMQCYTYKW